MSDYNHLSDGEQLRVDVHMLNYFRNNEHDFNNGFRRLVLESSHAQGITTQAAVVKVTADIRNALAARVSALSAITSNSFTRDRRAVADIVSDIQSIVEGETKTESYYDDAKIPGLVNAGFNAIRTGSPSSVSQSDLRIPAGADKFGHQIATYMNSRAAESHESNLQVEFGPAITAAVKKIPTGLSDYQEARAIEAAVAAVEAPPAVMFGRARQLLEKDADRLKEAKDVAQKLLNKEGRLFNQHDVDTIATAAIGIAKGQTNQR